MARKLKTFLTSLGFFDQAIAAPSMKAALEAWGADSNLFHQGFAREVDDPAIVEATMEKPGVVLKRPIGSSGPFKESAELPAQLPADGHARKQARRTAEPKAGRKKIDPKAARKVALAFESEEKKRDSERRREEVRRARERERREKDVARAEAALAAAEEDHARKAAAIERELAALEKRSEAEEARWRKLKSRLEEQLRRARS
ncbi:MAG: cell envelope biogenesis protein TolA [Bradyrhizobium sp.]|nr:cell envelope biogenesis protein TolA [Bradyrhizobium sp.]